MKFCLKSRRAWVALIGWAFSSNNTDMISLGAIVIIGFWKVFLGVYKLDI
jgi:hypothetical protein